jgi:hypothetical protein
VAGAGGSGGTGSGPGGGGGGAGGWFGGGGGESDSPGGGGGAGSSFAATGATGLAFASAPAGNGSVSITFNGGAGSCANPDLEASVASDGRTIDVGGVGFSPDTTVTIEIHSTEVRLGTVETDDEGSFESTFDVPCRVGAGHHTVTASADDEEEASASVRLDACSAAAPVVATPSFTG